MTLVAAGPAIYPRGPRPQRFTLPRAGLYVFLVCAAGFFLLPAYVMVLTSLKSMDEIRQAHIFALPQALDFSAWVTAWGNACAGNQCQGVAFGFWNSVKISVPSTIISVLFGAFNGYALSFWRAPGAKLLFGTIVILGFIPLQVFIFPMVRVLATIGIYSTLPGIIAVHVVFSVPLVTLLFRNYYASIPIELFKAARVDGAGFWRVFTAIMLPMSTPMLVVASLMQLTGIWNDFLLGLVFAGRDNLPMTVQLNNIVNTTIGERFYNVNMAATILTAAVPLIAYFVSGRWFVRGITAGSVKG
jgi:glucose/mannose transport system permease protein